VVGTNDTDIAAAANCIRDIKGGWAIALESRVAASLPLSIAGLMSELDANCLAGKIEDMKKLARSLGVKEGIDPFMTLAFVSLPVIPELRITTRGLFDVCRQELVPVIYEGGYDGENQ
jgi:adenine deaminase